MQPPLQTLDRRHESVTMGPQAAPNPGALCAPDSPRLAVVAGEAPPVTAAEALRAAVGMPPSFAWSPRTGGEGAWSFAGWGTAARADGAGEERLAEVRRRAERIFDRVERAGALPFVP